MLNVLKIVPDTIVDGPRMRTSIYLSGCNHECKGCHNRASWKFGIGKNYENQELIDYVLLYDHKRVTISGGDGLCYQVEGLISFLKDLKASIPECNIWLYTGYAWEELIVDPERKEVLEYIDVLVDGKFIPELRSTKCLFRGSTNQRLIDVVRSLNSNEVVLYSK
jgi:anaerobic ribonucleoside-triphosphate reductase activating protein